MITGNVDQKMIASMDQLLNYVAKYVMKPEAASIGFLEVVKKTSEGAGDNVPVRRTVQKIMLKLVAEHDRSKVSCQI